MATLASTGIPGPTVPSGYRMLVPIMTPPFTSSPCVAVGMSAARPWRHSFAPPCASPMLPRPCCVRQLHNPLAPPSCATHLRHPLALPSCATRCATHCATQLRRAHRIGGRTLAASTPCRRETGPRLANQACRRNQSMASSPPAAFFASTRRLRPGCRHRSCRPRCTRFPSARTVHLAPRPACPRCRAGSSHRGRRGLGLARPRQSACGAAQGRPPPSPRPAREHTHVADSIERACIAGFLFVCLHRLQHTADVACGSRH
eukprot:365420-Chlamydomonas_euryale.AAC.11